MLVKIMLIFLLAMVGAAMVGNFLFPGVLGRQVKQRMTLRKPKICPKCGRYVIGQTCGCGKKG